MIQSIASGNSPVSPSYHDRPAHRSSGRGHRAEASASHLEATTQRSGSLEVTTAEGDRVSISFSAAQQLQASQVEVRGRHGQKAGAENVAQSSSVEVEVSVEGSLSDQEVADIAKLLESLSAAARGQGTPKPVPSPAASGGYQTINSFQFQYQEQVEFQYSHSYLG